MRRFIIWTGSTLSLSLQNAISEHRILYIHKIVAGALQVVSMYHWDSALCYVHITNGNEKEYLLAIIMVTLNAI